MWASDFENIPLDSCLSTYIATCEKIVLKSNTNSCGIGKCATIRCPLQNTRYCGRSLGAYYARQFLEIFSKRKPLRIITIGNLIFTEDEFK